MQTQRANEPNPEQSRLQDDLEGRAAWKKQIQEKVEQIVMAKIAEAVQKKADEVAQAEGSVDEKKEVL